MPTGSLAHTSILIVEDDGASARMLATLLAAEGARIVRVAHSAEEALEILGTVPVAVLIADVVLPTMSGLDLVRRIKADPAIRDTTAIVLTAADDYRIQRDARDSGCVAFLRKPVDVDTLLLTVRGKSTRASDIG